MEPREFNRILRQVLILPIAALLLLAVALYLQIQGANQTVQLIQQSDDRITEATLAGKLIVDEESALRGYQTTSDVRFLQPYLDAQPHLQAQFLALERVPGADELQKSRLQDLRESHQTWHDGFAEPVIAAIRSGGRPPDVELNLHGKVLMDNIRDDLNEVVHEAQEHRKIRIERWRRQVHGTILGLFAFALIFGVAIGLFVRSRMHRVSGAYNRYLDILNRRAEDLFQSEEQLRTTLSSIGDGVITCDLEGRVLLMNPVAEELTGWTQEMAGGKSLEQVFRILDEGTQEPLENPITLVKRLNKPVGLTNHTVLRRRDGSNVSISDSGAPIRDRHGAMMGFVLVFRDNTMERRTQEALLANEKLVVAGRLAATIAHEIHNPLDSVSNLLYLMRTGATPEESALFMKLAEQELTRVTQISRAMLGLYRESKTPVRVDLAEMLKEILLLLEHRLTELGVTVQAELPAGVYVEGFPSELRQVFTNLITNAGEASQPGGQVSVSIVPGEVPVGPGSSRMEHGATIRIADNGSGISEEVKPLIFQPFFTTKGEHGTGLGLWVSQGIVTKHGGTISVESWSEGEGHGTVVSVFLMTKQTLELGAGSKG